MDLYLGNGDAMVVALVIFAILLALTACDVIRLHRERAAVMVTFDFERLILPARKVIGFFRSDNKQAEKSRHRTPVYVPEPKRGDGRRKQG